MRRVVTILLLALVLPVLLAGGVGSAAVKRPKRKVTCKATQSTLVVRGRKTCLTPSKLLAKPSGKPISVARVASFGIGLTLGSPIVTRLTPKRAHPSRTPAYGVLRRVRTKLPELPGPAAMHAANFRPGQSQTSQNADGSTSSRADGTVTDDATGAKGTVEAEGRQEADGTTSVTLDLGIFDKTGAGGSFTIRMPVSREITGQATCPTATGDIERRRKDSFANRVHQTRPGFGVAFIDQSVRYQGETTVKGKVDDTATLTSAEYTGTATLTMSYEAKLLGGLIHPDWQVEFKLTATGTIDGRTGRRSPGQATITARSRGVSTADLAVVANDPKLREQLTQLLADNVDGAFKSLKSAETGWQAPNACAALQLSPPTGPSGLGKGDSAQFTGEVQARQGGGTASGRWTLQQQTAGTQSGLPGASAPGAPITVRLTATQDVDENTVAAGVTVRATSPAGVAERSWSAAGKPAGPPFYYRIVGGSATQRVVGTRTNPNGSHIDQVEPVQYAWSFTPSSGPPDGSVTADGPYGEIEAAAETTTEHPWTWRTDADGGHSHPVGPRTWPGPTVTMVPPPGDNRRLIVSWNVLGVPDLQYSADLGAPDGTYSTLGPDCVNQAAADLASDSLPLSFFAQRSFTLSIDRDWHVDRTSSLGHDVCSGHLSASLTLQRVQADGSPLP